MQHNVFPVEIHSDIGYYVYRLIDPRNGATFYVGKGYGNRVFDHIRDAIKFEGDEDAISEKLKTIRDIHLADLEPIHVIHRHGMTEDESFLAEAVLIDAVQGLTNLTGGHGSVDYGPAHSTELIQRYKSEVMEIDSSHNIMAINVRISTGEEGKSIYDAVRFAWRISLDRANRADFVFAVTNGICKEVFVPGAPWLPATKENFPLLTNEDIPGRYGFVGTRAAENILALYKNKQLPEAMQRRKGMASPVLYNYS